MIEFLWSIFDISLVLLLLALAWATCSTQDMMRAVTLFIALGLLIAAKNALENRKANRQLLQTEIESPLADQT